ncbi:hypothetical protein B5S33_g3306 [[Candida] boidinii]|nr:hypothetical protein B5S30_g5446 [[Candida] boidinii]OWB84656.1 hypothetical protein B5S33_g3306 [[Candida] boidinii]GMG15423.1 unnamed protein product [[Candida] boidinii]
MPIDPEKLAKLQKASAKKVGGARIKAKKINKTAEADDSNLQATLRKLDAQILDGVEEANFFKDDGSVLHFNRVGVQGAAAYNTFGFTGYAQEKSITELIPQILPQLGAENLNMLQQIAESIKNNQGAMGALKQSGEAGDLSGAAAAAASAAAGDDEIPDLVEGENFENEVE